MQVTMDGMIIKAKKSKRDRNEKEKRKRKTKSCSSRARATRSSHEEGWVSVIASKHGWDDDEWMDGWMDGIQQIVYVQGHSFKSMICMNLLQIITIGIDRTKKETRRDEKKTRGMRGKKKTRKENVKFITNRKETKREKWRVVLTPPLQTRSKGIAMLSSQPQPHPQSN